MNSYWEHDAQESLDTAIPAMLGRLADNPRGINLSDLRLLAMATCIVCQELTTDPDMGTTVDNVPLVKLPAVASVADKDHGDARATLLRFWELLAQAVSKDTGVSISDMYTGSTKGDGPWASSPLEESPKVVGVWPALAIVGVAIVAAVGICYCVHEGAQVIEYVDKNMTASEEVIHAQAMALQAAKNHTDAEKEAGKPLPLNDAEKAALGQAKDAQDKAFGIQAQPPSGGGLFDNPLALAAIAVVLAVGVGSSK